MNTAQVWDNSYSNGRDFMYIKTSDLTNILDHAKLRKNGSTLDIGCGTGQLARDLFHRGYEVLGIDLSPVAIEIARKSSVYVGEKLNFEVKDFEKDELMQKKFDLVICKYVYAFINNQGAFLTKVKKMMDSGSVFIIISPNPETTPPQKSHICVDKDLTNKKLKSLFKNVEFIENSSDNIFICRD